ncbi:MAG TPA: hypothetical protein VF335_01620, partial [Chitinivibrionales bacterium]
MTSSVSLITGRFVAMAAPRISGKGIVETVTEQGRAVIVSGSQKLIVQLTSGSLRQGDTVVFKAQGDAVFIERISIAAAQPALFAADAFETEGAGADEAFQKLLLQLARQLGGEAPDRETLQRLSQALGALAKKIPEYNAECQMAATQLINYALPILQSARALETLDVGRCVELLQSFLSKLAASAPPPVFQVRPGIAEGYYFRASTQEVLQWASESGFKVPGAGKAIGGATANGVPVVFKVYGMEADVNRCTVMSKDDAGRELLHYIRANLSHPFWKLITAETLTTLMAQQARVSSSRLADIDALLLEKVDAAAVIPAAAHSAGHTQAPGISEAVRAALQTQWLSVACDETTGLGAMPSPPPDTGGAAAMAAWVENGALSRGRSVPDIFKALIINTNTVNQTGVDAAAAQKPALPALLRALGFDFEHAFSDSVSFGENPTGPESSLKGLLLKALAQMQAGANGSVAEIIDKTREKVLLLSQRLARDISALFTEIGDTSAQALKEARSNFGNRLETFAADVMSIADGSLQATFRPTLHQLETALDALVSRLSEDVNIRGSMTGDAPKNIQGQPGLPLDFTTVMQNFSDAARQSIGEAARCLDEALTAAVDQSGSSALSEGRRMETGLQRNLHGVLERIDSLQILAKPVATAQGEARVVVLPMKIDGQWNDVVMKLVKDRRGSQSSKGAHNVSVDVHVAPALLGAIDVNMEYATGRALSIRMAFEKDAVGSWFEQNKAALTQAIRSLGISTVYIHVQ